MTGTTKRLRIDFARPGLAEALYRAGPAEWLLAVAALGTCACAGWLGWQGAEQRRQEAAEQAAARARRPAPAPAQSAARPHIAERQARAVNAAILQLNLPWSALGSAIVGATPAGVALLALEPDAHKRVIRITAETRSADDMVDYVAQLGKSEFFTDAALTRHEINQQDPNRPIRFQIEASWSTP